VGDRKGGGGGRDKRGAGGAAAVEESGVVASALPSPPLVAGSPREKILAALLRVEPGADLGHAVSLTELRAAVGAALGKAAFDREVVRLVERGILTPFQHASPERLPPAERAAMVEAGRSRGQVGFEAEGGGLAAVWNAVSVRDPSALPKRKGR
jgi:hypothetical protein